MSPRRRRTLLTTGLLAVLLLAAAAVSAQRFGGFGSFREGTFPTLWAPPTMPEASFTFCRLAYRSVRFEQSGIGWQTDYPYAEINLMTRLSELTKTRIGHDDSQTPRHYVVRLTDDTLFNCPFLMASDPGTMGLSDAEADRLRTYLLKGGFFWVDDYWGTAAWNQFESQIGKVLPAAEYPIEDVALDDPMMHSVYSMTHVPQISNFQFWRPLGRAHLGARRRQRRSASAGHPQRQAAGDGGDDAQHRHRRLVGARGRRPGLLPPVLARRLRARRQRARPRDDPLTRVR